MFYVLLIVVAAVAVVIYLVFFMQNVPGALEERWGELEPLPPDLGVWKVVEQAPGGSAEGNPLIVEQRHYFDESRGRLLRQTRYRHPETGAITAADPDEVIKRRRVKKPA